MTEEAKNTTHHAASIVSAYVSKNYVTTQDLPSFISSVHQTLHTLKNNPVGAGKRAGIQATHEKPAVPVNESVKPDYIVCLEDGLRFKSLKRHLKAKYDLSPDQYRRKWQLPDDYPMVSPNYSKRRRDIIIGQDR